MRHLAYCHYLVGHKYRVLIHALRLGIPLRGLSHDLSKLSAVEWFGIGRQFFPSSPAEKDANADLFREAKAHHRRANEHELDHWYGLDGAPARVPEPVLREVVADWAAFQGVSFSLAEIKRLAARSYSNWGKNFRMHPETRAWLLTFLEIPRSEDHDSR
jgi:hypothetical protein